MIGTKLAHYEITQHLGSGGMGEVYEATDSKLARNVAIKLLPEAFARDAERLARFEREARLLASLNHPHIAAIYGLEESGQRNFLVMELVTGETLAERIARGSLPVDEALAIARQIAEALAAAHERGVMHRDLKPANIKVTASGQVKVLDFGLAKALGDGERANLQNSPTLSLAATNAGVILGTAAYMSPEQARGMPVDHRTDIFAFGAVLYEMLTGRQAFPGDTISDVLAAVLKTEPDWKRLPEDTPPAVRRLLHRCLQKDRNRRLHAAADAQIEIEETRNEPDESRRNVAAPHPSKLAWIVSAIAILAGVLLVVSAYLRQPSHADAAEMRLEIRTPVLSDPLSFALSPDGRQIVFGASEDGTARLWVRSLDSVAVQPLSGTENGRYPFWSPDSKSIGFFDGSRLKRLDLVGGQTKPLAEAAPGFGGSWGPDGKILFSATISSPLLQVPASGGGEVVEVTTVARQTQSGHRFPQFLPGGQHFLFFVEGAEDIRGIYFSDLGKSGTTRVTGSDTAGFYLPPGWLLFSRQGSLMGQRFDVERGQVSGEPVRLADALISTRQAVPPISAAYNGLIAYLSGAATKNQLTWFDRSGKPLGTLGPPDGGDLGLPELSPDGSRAVVRRTEESNTDIWLWDNLRKTRFTFLTSVEQYAIWSPNGRSVAFGSNPKGFFDIYQKPADSPGSDPQLLFASDQSKNLDDWSPDGRFILYNSENPKTGRDLWVLPLDKDGKAGKPFEFLKTGFEEHRGQFSPNGRWVAYVTNESRSAEINVRAFPHGNNQRQISSGGGVQPRWSPDGKEIYYIAPDGKLMATPVTEKGDVLEPGAPVPLFQTHIVGGANIYTRPQYDVARNGNFLINVPTEGSSTSAITLLLNWRPPAK